MNDELNLVNVKINISSSSGYLDANALQTTLFITESETPKKAIVVTKLKDLLDFGYKRESVAYNFCLGVSLNKKGSRVIVVGKGKDESYVDALKRVPAKVFYFICLESKLSEDVLSVHTNIIASKQEKLIFTSSNEDLSEVYSGCDRLVYYYCDSLDFKDIYQHYLLYDSEEIVEMDTDDLLLVTEVKPEFYNQSFIEGKSYLNTDDLKVISTDSNLNVILSDDSEETTQEEAQSYPLFYPEGAWIGRCCTAFPSEIQWLYKSFPKQLSNNSINFPKNSNTSLQYGSNPDLITVGCNKVSSLLCDINEQIGLDWLVMAIRKKLWLVLYQNEKVLPNEKGISLFKTALTSVLDNAKNLGLLSEWSNLQTQLNRVENNIGFTFDMKTTQTILTVKMTGEIYT